MPELPEVETLRCKLEKLLVGKKIKDVYIYDPSRISGLELSLVKDSMVLGVGRRGKYLYMDLSSGHKLVFHLRLKGRLVYGEDSYDLKDPWIKIEFYDDKGRSLFFGDVRRMATLDCVKDLNEIGTIANMGPEPFDEAFNLDFLKGKLMRSSKSIKALLMDQSFVAGIGNVYADEILYRAGIHPERKAKTLSSSEVNKLYISIREVLKEALKHGGVGEYTSLGPNDGEIGDFERFLMVHGKEGESCPRCGTTITKISVGGRGSYFCPKCQL